MTWRLEMLVHAHAPPSEELHWQPLQEFDAEPLGTGFDALAGVKYEGEFEGRAAVVFVPGSVAHRLTERERN